MRGPRIRRAKHPRRRWASDGGAARPRRWGSVEHSVTQAVRVVRFVAKSDEGPVLLAGLVERAGKPAATARHRPPAEQPRSLEEPQPEHLPREGGAARADGSG